MRRVVEYTVYIEVEATNKDVLVEGLHDLELDAKSNTEGFRVLDIEIIDGIFNYAGLGVDEERNRNVTN